MNLRLIQHLFKNTIIFLFFFTLIYFEPFEILGLKISMIWKMPFVLLLLIYNFYNIQKIFLFVSILLSVNIIVNMGFPSSTIGDISEVVELLSIPLIYYYAEKRFRGESEKLERIIVYIASFYILSTIPFILHILEPRGLIKELDKFGEFGNMLNGIFFHPSISSKVYVTSTLIIFNYILDTKRRKIFYHFIFILGLIAVYLSFTRTGWITLLIGIVLLLTFRRGKIEYLIKISPLILFGVITIFYIVKNNDSLRMRIIGGRTYRSNEDLDMNKLSSNRLFLYFGAYQVIKKSSVLEKLIGYGQDGSKEQMDKQIGLALVAHNRFLEIILMGGFISFFLYLYYLFIIFKMVFQGKLKSQTNSLTKTLFILLIIYNFPSHGFPLWCDITFALVLAHDKIKQHENNIYNRELS